MSVPAITLTITNIDNLIDGGPTIFSSQGEKFQIGRDAHRGWTLPDPRCFISGNHCEIQFDGQDYILTDVSRNGTFVNGSQNRVKGPYRLVDGDVLAIGHYMISVRIVMKSGEDISDDSWMGNNDDEDIWGAPAQVATPAHRRAFANPSAQGHRSADFVESYMDMPEARPAAGQFGRPEIARPPVPEQQQFPSPRPPTSAAPVREEFRGVSPGNRQADEFLAAFGAGAQLSPHLWHGRNPVETAQEIGAIMLLIAEQVSQLLRARASAKSLARTSSRTMIGAVDNNPLKFLPSAHEALEAMFARDRPGYLDAMRAFRDAFDDLKTHEIATYAAMQKALSRLLADFSPEAIEAKVEKSAFSNRKAKAWDVFVAHWHAKTDAHENGMLDVFLQYFAEAYQEASGRPKS